MLTWPEEASGGAACFLGADLAKPGGDVRSPAKRTACKIPFFIRPPFLKSL
jgi:hypothetical protein